MCEGGTVETTLYEAFIFQPEKSNCLVLLDEALTRLAEIDERKSRVVEMRFFGGLSVEETAEVLAVAPNTVIRDWRLARAWLRQYLSGDEAPNEPSLAAD